MTDICSVCIDPFTKQPSHKQVVCPYCDVKACVGCTQKYLVSQNDDPHCMNCRHGWTREFMDSKLLSTWLNGEYKKHREKILLDREKSRLPAAQVIVERRKQALERQPILDGIAQQMRDLEKQLATLQRQYNFEVTVIENLRQGIDPYANVRDAAFKEKEVQERRVFVMPCPATDCRGFLSSAYKCGVCDIYVCPDCREIKGDNRDAEHTCNPDTVATVQALKKECKPCPECGTNIFKIEGCDLMFCTHCNTPFDWKSGRKITHGRIHNPHYFEYLRATNGGVMPRNPGDIPCGNNIPTGWRFRRAVSSLLPEHTYYNLSMTLHGILHLQDVELPRVTTTAADLDNTEYNVQYLTKVIDENRWKQLLQQKEKRRNKKDEIRLQYEAFIGACSDIYGRLMSELDTLNRCIVPGNKEKELATSTKALQVITEAGTQMQNLQFLFYSGMMTISKRYKCQVQVFVGSPPRLVAEKFKLERSTKEGKMPKSASTSITTTPSNEVIEVE